MHNEHNGRADGGNHQRAQNNLHRLPAGLSMTSLPDGTSLEQQTATAITAVAQLDSLKERGNPALPEAVGAAIPEIPHTVGMMMNSEVDTPVASDSTAAPSRTTADAARRVSMSRQAQLDSGPIGFTPSQVRMYYHARVPDLEQRGTEWRGPCPVHNGEGDNFAVHAETGQWYCHSCCQRGGDIIQLERELTGVDFPTALAQVNDIVGRPFKSVASCARRIVRTYDYVDEQDQLQFQVVRYEPKDFAQRRPGGRGGWTWNLRGIRPVLYKLPAVLASQRVFVVEGERDVESIEGLGLAATCNPMGAGKWRPAYSQFLAGKDVVIISDNDGPGRAHASKIEKALKGVAARLRVIILPSGKDVTEWLNGGGTREQLEELVAATDDWPVLVPMDRTELPSLPREALPGWFGDHAAAVAEATETPLELAALLDLAVISTCCAGKFVVSPQRGYEEPVNIYTAPAMESGNRKTAVLMASTAPLREWEHEAAEAIALDIARLTSIRKTMEFRIEALRKQAAKAEDDTELRRSSSRSTRPKRRCQSCLRCRNSGPVT
jgi:hypothetical protein